MSPEREPPVARLVLEIVQWANPVCGRVGPLDGELETFTGWTGLATVIERVRTRPDPPPCTPDPG